MIRFAATVITRSLFRSVRVDGIDAEAMRGPTLLVASHFGGFADPVMLLSVVPSTPRYLAKSTLWDAFWLAPLLNMVHAIPIYRAEDGATEENLNTFEAASQAMLDGETVAIFPEGFANDAPGLQPAKTGAARLAIDAFAAGVRGARIVPVVTQYERKTRMRTRVWLRQGEPIDLDSAIAQVTSVGRLAEGETVTSEDRDAVRALTEMISMKMRDIGPVYEDEEQAAQLELAAEVQANRLGGAPAERWLLTTALANRFARLAPSETATLRADASEYGQWLREHRLEDASFSAPRSPRVASALLLAVGVVLLLPFAFVGVVMNLVPWAIVAGGRALRNAPVKEVTINVFVAPVIFPITWLVWGFIEGAAWGWWAGLLATLAGPALGWIALVWRDLLGRVRHHLSSAPPIDPPDSRDRLRASADALLSTPG